MRMCEFGCVRVCVSWVCTSVSSGVRAYVWVVRMYGLYLPYTNRKWTYATIPGSHGLHLFDQLVWVYRVGLGIHSDSI